MEPTTLTPAAANVQDLTIKYKADRSTIVAEVKKAWNYAKGNIHPKYSIGDIIEFYGGTNSDIRYRSEILGFTTENKIFVLWDCFWFPIEDSEERKIKKVS